MPERLAIRLRRSPTLALLLGSAHSVAWLGAWLVPAPAWLKATATVVIAVSLFDSLWQHALRSARGAIVELELNEDCAVNARSLDGAWSEYRVHGASAVSRLLTVLTLRAEGEWTVRAVLITSDALDADAFRQLRVWLKWRCRAGAEPSGGA